MPSDVIVSLPEASWVAPASQPELLDGAGGAGAGGGGGGVGLPVAAPPPPQAASAPISHAAPKAARQRVAGRGGWEEGARKGVISWTPGGRWGSAPEALPTPRTAAGSS